MKKAVICALTILYGIVVILSFGCKTVYGDDRKLPIEDVYVRCLDSFGVEINLIKLPDGKVILVDCGNIEDGSLNALILQLELLNIDTIDYFIITHPDLTQMGGALRILNDYTVKEVFISDLYKSLRTALPEYFDIVDKIKDSAVKIHYICSEKFFAGQDYLVCFLTPLHKDVMHSSYNDIIATRNLSDKLLDSISPIIYLDIYGVRIVLATHATASQEKVVLENYKTKIYYNGYYGHGKKIKLADVDLLHLSQGGSDNASTNEFLSILHPDSVVISVGQTPPATAVLKRVELQCNYKIYRTDMVGNVTMNISEDVSYVY